MKIHLKLEQVLPSLVILITLQHNFVIAEDKNIVKISDDNLKDKDIESEDAASVIDANEDDSIFLPTKEWKKVGPNQKVPAGLHIRMNLQTGNKEAKLLEEEDPVSKRSSAISIIENSSNEENEVMKEEFSNAEEPNINNNIKIQANIIEALKNIKSEDNKTPEESKLDAKKRKHKFRSYNEIKAEFDELNINIQTDADILDTLITEYKSLLTKDEIKVNILEDLDYLIHQIDNAVNFVQMGGIKNIVQPGLNSSNEEIRKGVMRLLGSASQSNPKVQIAVLEEGLLSQLLRIVAREKDLSVSSKAVFALSCLVRGFPYGQQKLIENGGLHTLREVFHKEDWQSLSLQIKVVSLIEDLLVERLNASVEKEMQFGKVDLMGSLVEGEWCSAVSSLLARASFDKRGKRDDMSAALNKEIPLRPDHDMVDKVVSAMALMASPCASDFHSSVPLLMSLEKTYWDLAYKEQYQGDDGHEFFQNLANQIRYLLNHTKRKEEL